MTLCNPYEAYKFPGSNSFTLVKSFLLDLTFSFYSNAIALLKYALIKISLLIVCFYLITIEVYLITSSY